RFALLLHYLTSPPGGAAFSPSTTLSRSSGGTGSATAPVAVANAAPAGLALNAGAVDEGGTFGLTGSFTDPGVLDAHTVVIDWGDGSAPTTLAPAPGVLTIAARHTYLDDL